MHFLYGHSWKVSKNSLLPFKALISFSYNFLFMFFMFYFITFYSIFLRIFFIVFICFTIWFSFIAFDCNQFYCTFMGHDHIWKKKQKTLVGTVYIKLQRISKGNTATVLSEQFALCSGRNILKWFSFKILGHNHFSVWVKLKLNEFSLVKWKRLYLHTEEGYCQQPIGLV